MSMLLNAFFIKKKTCFLLFWQTKAPYMGMMFKWRQCTVNCDSFVHFVTYLLFDSNHFLYLYYFQVRRLRNRDIVKWIRYVIFLLIDIYIYIFFCCCKLIMIIGSVSSNMLLTLNIPSPRAWSDQLDEIYMSRRENRPSPVIPVCCENIFPICTSNHRLVP